MTNERLRVVGIDGTRLDVELISILDDHTQKYLIYTKGEKQVNGNIIMYVSKLRIKDGIYYLDNIVNDKEWNNVKKLMNDVAGNK